MSSAPYSRELAVAEQAVQHASVLTKNVLRSMSTIQLDKSDNTPVTVADFAAQAILISAVRGAFPEDYVIGEENADTLREDKELCQQVWELLGTVYLDGDNSGNKGDLSGTVLGGPRTVEDMLDAIDAGGGTGKRGPKGRIWILDPLDGTAAFLRGEQYSVSLALVVDGREEIGVTGCPNLPLGWRKSRNL